ncbi:MAG: serine/threonine-protein phosphatase [Lachnospiraceae bacterium]|nr:serine/threonine-protein phosphatase [Lachnospiraceae bacterium]
MADKLSWYWDKGNFRKKNEDSFTAQKVRLNGRSIPKRCLLGEKGTEAALLAVCDGIGGLPEGECASGFVAEELTEWFYQEGIQNMNRFFWRKNTVQSACSAFEKIQQKLERIEKEENICCGTTCTMALLKNGRYLILHTGDSRAYRIGRRERLLTKDHHQGGALRRCLGAFGFHAPDVLQGRLHRGEMLLLCTDGFCRLAADGFFQGCLPGEEDDVAEYYKRLKGAASFLKAQGEKDNLTAVLYVRQ